MRSLEQRQHWRWEHVDAARRQPAAGVVQCVAGVVSAEADAVADAFYDRLLTDVEGREFLTTAVVHSRLRRALVDWLHSLFVARLDPTTHDTLGGQHEIGAVHARIGVPLTLVNWGLRLVKQELAIRVTRRLSNPGEVAAALGYVNEVLDIAADAMSEAYLANVVTTARHQQALSLFLAGNSLAVECERARSSLFNWHREVALALLSDTFDAIHTLRESELGLWLFHKAELTIAEPREAQDLRRVMDGLDRRVARHLAEVDPQDRSAHREFVRDLAPEVDTLSQLLSQLGERAVSVELGRDPLTRLLNRRYLPAILQHQLALSRREGTGFGLLMVDADNFKVVNDLHGHQIGDQVLARLAETLLGSVRASDFVFRYGGEEFLLVLPGVSWPSLERKAEQVLAAVRALTFADQSAPPFRLTVSVGGALFEGHPDYQQVVHRADRALGLAKEGGRDRVVLLRAEA